MPGQAFSQYGQTGYAAGAPYQDQSNGLGGQAWYDASTHAQPTFILGH